MSLKRVIIVEDSVSAVNKLTHHLGKHLDIDVIGVFDATLSAEQILKSGQVDGVFLDIGFREAGGGETDGLDLASRISYLSPAPWIIFITGHEKHALDVINLLPPNMLYGYLLKPYTETQLLAMLAKVRYHARSIAMPQTIPATPRIEVRHKKITALNGHIDHATITTVIDIADIRYIHQDLTVNIHLINGEVLAHVNLILKAWGEILLTKEFDYFQRIHNQSIVNLKYANGIRPDPDREECFLALFKSCADQLKIGPKYSKAYKEAIKIGKRVDP